MMTWIAPSIFAAVFLFLYIQTFLDNGGTMDVPTNPEWKRPRS